MSEHTRTGDDLMSLAARCNADCWRQVDRIFANIFTASHTELVRRGIARGEPRRMLAIYFSHKL
jgi:hypothetical protein